jgi:peptide/nickel transport system permease protein
MNTSLAERKERFSSMRTTARWKWLRMCLSHRSMMVGTVTMLLIVLIALVVPALSPYTPVSRDISRILSSPDSQNLFGTDHYGRDVMTRVAAGARISLVVGISVILFSGVAGTLIGLASGYVRWIDNLLMRIMDVLMAFPSFLLAIGILAILGPRLINVVIALAVVYTPLVARVVRGTTLQLKEIQFVEAARASGATGTRILGRHIFPNCIGPLTVQLTVIFALSVLAEASLSFIGAGVPPDVSSWGIILSHGRDYLQTGPWIALAAGTAISITVLAVNLFGDGLRDVTDPHLRNR